MAGAVQDRLAISPRRAPPRQLKKEAVNSNKVKNNSLRAVDFAAGQLPEGPQGVQGTAGTAKAAGTVAKAGTISGAKDPTDGQYTIASVVNNTTCEGGIGKVVRSYEVDVKLNTVVLKEAPFSG